MKKLTCHCGGVEIQFKLSDEGFKKIIRCNCSLCKRKGYIIGIVGPDDLKIAKGENLLKLYQYHTKTAKHYFCSNCGVYTHSNPRSNPKLYGLNLGCVEDVDPVLGKEYVNLQKDPDKVLEKLKIKKGGCGKRGGGKKEDRRTLNK